MFTYLELLIKRLNLSRQIDKNGDYVKVEFSSDEEEQNIQELRAYFIARQKENLIDLENYRVFLISIITFVVSLDRLRFYLNHQNLQSC